MKTTRRNILASVPAIAAAAAVPAAQATPARPSVRMFLDDLMPSELVMYHANQLAEVMTAMHGGHYIIRVSHEDGFVMVVDMPKKQEAEGPLLADDVTGTTDFADWQKRREARR